MSNILSQCTRCRLPETYETIEFDDSGVCNICHGAQFKNQEIDWTERRAQLDELINKHRGKHDYDCIVPFSGGKDSTFQLYFLVKEYGLKPLVVRFNHGFMRKTIEENCQRTFRKLGVDALDFRPNWKIVKKLMLESFKRKTDFCWHCHTGIYSYPLRVALNFNIPLIIWGETQSEITAYYDYESNDIEYEDDRKFNLLRTLGITAEDMHGMINSDEDPVDARDLIPYTYPDTAKLRDLGCVSVPLGSFIPWNYEKQTKIIQEELGWEIDTVEGVPREVNNHGEKIECFMQGTRDYIKYLKRGYSRVAQINAFKVRQGTLTPEQAEEINREFDGRKPESLQIFLEYVGLTESEFNQFIDSNVIPPYSPSYDSTKIADKPWDFDSWPREDNRK